MHHSHGVDNCSLIFCRKGRQLDLGKTRCLNKICQRNLLLASHQLWAYVHTFWAAGDDGDGDYGDDDDGDDCVRNGDDCTRRT
jgi:hypothetical protein